MMEYDLIVIGGGPAGYHAAELAGKSGLKTLLFEKKHIGGVCLNEGCIPTKTLLYGAKVYDMACQSAKYGVLVTSPTVDFEKMMSRKNRIVRRLTAGIESSLKQHQVQIVIGAATIKEKTEKGLVVVCNEQAYLGRKLLICTGSETVIPNIPGMDMTSDVIITHREALELKEIPQSLVVIGGGVIGLEFASLYQSLGCKVTVIEMLPTILNGIDTELSAQLKDMYAKKGISFYLNARVTRMDQQKVSFEQNDEMQEIFAEKILLSVGRKPVIQGLGLENIGVQTERGRIVVNDFLETNVEGVYAAGDVNGFSLLAHTASREGAVVVNNLTRENEAMNYEAIPSVVYTNPEIAGVGLTETEAIKKNIPHRVIKLPMAFSGRFVAENEGVNGVCKVLVDEQNHILGVHLLGNPASELIFGAGMAIQYKFTLEQLQKVVFPHPTVSEIMHVAFSAE